MNRDLMYLPERCYAVLPQNGRLVTVTRGGPGYRRSTLDTGNREQNRVIADQKNAELGGVTPEQEKDMIDGAIFGWELVLYRNSGLLSSERVFQVEISNNTPESYTTSVTLHLPASWAEFHDALQKARIEDARNCKIELLQSRRKDLPASCIGSKVNLYELNLLAQRLAWQTKDQNELFAGMVKIEQLHNSGVIPMRRLVNLTFNLDNCCMAWGVKDDKALGVFMYENEMLSDEAMRMLDAEESDSEYADQMLEVLGKKHRELEGGVFTSQGYLEATGGDFQDVFIPGEISYFLRSDAPVVLTVSKGFFNDPHYENQLTASLDLPACDEMVWRAAEAVGAASPKECCYRCADCLIPAVKELIDNAIDDVGDIGQANEFARMLKEQERHLDEKGWSRYKALLQANRCADLGDAMQLMYELDEYELRPEVASSWQYAEMRLREKYPDLPEALFQTGQSAQIGEQMLAEDNAALTSYGLIRRKDGGPLPELEHQPDGLVQRMD